MRRILAPALLVAALAAGPARAGKSAGSTSLDFLNLDAGARAVALGGAYTALANDANALLYNPAGLGGLKAHEVTLMHNEYVQGLTQEYVGLATRQGFGGTLNYLRFGDVTRTRLDAPDGTLGAFSLSDLALSAGYGHAFKQGALSLGAGLKYLREDVDGVSATGAAFDAGLLAAPPAVPGLTLGLSLMNAGPGVRYASDSSPLPTTARLGSAYAFKGWGQSHLVALDFTQQTGDALRFGLGFETIFAKMLALRVGFTSRNDVGFGVTGGVGWLWENLSIDYAFAPYGDLGLAHRLSLSFRWGADADGDVPRQTFTEHRRAQREIDRAAPPNASVEYRFLRSDEESAAGRFEEARKELASIDASLDPDDRRRVRYHERMGALLSKRKDCVKAKPHYVEALRQASALGLSDTYVADSYAGMGFCLLAQGNDSYASRFLKKALEAGPSEETRRRVDAQLRRMK